MATLRGMHVSDYQLKIGWKYNNVMSLDGVEGVTLSEDVFDDFVRTTPSLIILDETVILLI